jgi:Domain of unknown function (DUF4167)
MYESNGPDIKIRGTASHVAEKYLQLARDAQSSGDPVAAENYYQHAEHYFRLIAAAQEQFRQSQPYFQQGGDQRGNVGDDGYDDGDEQPSAGEPFAPREQQPFYPREQQNQPQQFQPRQQHDSSNEEDVERLPSFITGGGGQPHQQQPEQPEPQQAQGHNGGNGPNGSNGQNGYDNSADRFPLHRRRRRHRGPRDHSTQGEGDGPSGPRSSDD